MSRLTKAALVTVVLVALVGLGSGADPHGRQLAFGLAAGLDVGPCDTRIAIGPNIEPHGGRLIIELGFEPHGYGVIVS